MNMKLIQDVVGAATGCQDHVIEKIPEGFKVISNGTLTRGDARRIEAGFGAINICARVSPGRFQKIWIKPEDRRRLNRNL